MPTDNPDCTKGMVLEERVSALEKSFYTFQDSYNADKQHSQENFKELFHRTDKVKDELTQKIHSLETTLNDKLTNLEKGINKEFTDFKIEITKIIAKIGAKLAVLVIVGTVFYIILRVLMTKVFGVSI